MNTKSWAAALAVLTLGTGAQAAGFVNGGFEDGTTSGWVIGGGSRASQNLSTVDPSQYLPGGSRYNASIATTHSSVVGPGPDMGSPVGALLGNRVYSGANALRVEDTVTGGWVSVASQTVNNYTDANIFFAWKAVLENGGHNAEESAGMIITLTDLTSNTVLIDRRYNAAPAGGGVDARFSQQGSYFYTPAWQIEQLAIDASLSGHNFRLDVLASDCAPTGHEGYVYLDGFGAVIPTDELPEPGSIALVGAALLGLAAARRRKQA